MTENEKKLRKNIGKKIKLARSKTNYTQEALAEKTSLSPRYISQLERGEKWYKVVAKWKRGENHC